MLTDIINSILDENRKARAARRAKVEKRAQELNAGWAKTLYSREGFEKVVAPTWGIDDRPHAPFDGYLWENELGEVEAYHGGSYLPYVTELDVLDKPEFTGDFGWWKLRLTSDMFNELKLYGCPIEIREPYKHWELEDNTTVLMAEIRAHKSILEAIQKYSEEKFSEIYAKLNENKGEAPEGKQTVKGKVVSVKCWEDYYGMQVKMMVRLENGATAYGSLPKAVPMDYRGEIEFKATFERAKDDNTHAFYKRPSAVKMLTN
ncbi:hypothetical protein ACQ31_gp148 [Salmonella phage STML-198]|uniref:Uncharacterized protein n=2 Tax=Gelderlandvirus TaxID=1913653 RepID=K4I251_9CAUD|nr:hypothetical protein ACQ31_gp148 [Salmonella phage STML-198]YP_009615566.1 hypothetical protein FDI73_gp080 [Salmonella phage Melville]AFU64031.1 hypothetical protein [Salmonella phage STML-198]ATN93054.1 hypothetical protein CPT_Melville_080 [Salmonella phage Melville]UPW42455.1 hypothetical protein EBPHNEJP_00157 [Salmonella phage CF-SP2]